MVRVRVYDADQVAPASTTGARFRPADGGGVGFAIGEGLAALGQAGARHAEMQEDINLRFDDTESRKAAQRYQTGAAQIVAEFQLEQGANAYSKREAVGEALDKLKAETLGSLTNQRMLQMAGDRISGLYGADRVKIAEHATRQLNVEQESTLKAQILLSGEDAAANWMNPELLGKHRDTMIAAVEDLGAFKGWSPDVIRLEKSNAVSAMHKDVVNRLLADDDIDAADAYLEANANELNANDELALRNTLKEPLLRREAQSDFDRAVNTMPVPETASTKDAAPTGTSLDAMVAVTAQSESGNRERDSNGRLITSPKGAQGRMQVMPTTNLDPGFGVKAAKDGSDAERTRVGRDYLAAMLKRYGNDPAKAWAAYNAGPGRVDDAIAEGGDWLARLPQETRDYVKKNMEAIGGGTGPQQSARTWDKSAVYSQIDALADREAWSPERRERAKEWADKEIARDEQLKARDENQAEREASEWVLKNPNFTDVSQMPAAIRDRLPPSTLLQYMDAGKRNAAPKEVQANGQTALDLTLLAINDPQRFKQESLGQYAGLITRSELEELAKKQATMRVGEGKWSPRTGIMSAIDWGKKVGQVKLSDKEYAAVYQYMERELTDRHGKGAEITSKDYEAAFLNATRSVPTTSTLGFSGEEPVYRLTPTDKQRARAIERLKARGITDPTEEEILTVFRVDGLRGQ